MSDEHIHSVNADGHTKSIPSWLIFCAGVLETFGIILAFRFQRRRNLVPKKTGINSETRQVQVLFSHLKSCVEEEVFRKQFFPVMILDFVLV